MTVNYLWNCWIFFENDYSKKRKGIDGFIKSNNYVQLREVAHSLKGAAGNISAKALQDTCSKMEQWAEEQDMKSIAGILGTLDKQFSQLQAHIAELKMKK